MRFNDKSLPFINRIMETRKSFLFYGPTQHNTRIFCEFDISIEKNSSEIKFLGRESIMGSHPTAGRLLLDANHFSHRFYKQLSVKNEF